VPTIRPFRAIRYAAGTDLSGVTAPAYDVVAPAEREELAARDPHNIIHVTLEADRPGDDAQTNKYTRAANRLRSWLAEGILVRDTQERLHLYRLDHPPGHEDQPRTTVGVVAALELSPLGAEVAPHEQTMPGPKADRLELMRTTHANLEPLWFVAARPLGGVGALADRLAQTPPQADVTDPEGTRHRVWDIPPEDAEGLIAAAGEAPFVIADGHHRYETALAYRDERRASDGPGPWDFTLGLVVDPVEYPPVLHPIHRLVEPSSAAGLLDEVRRLGLEPFSGDTATLVDAVAAGGPGTVGVASREGCWTLASRDAPDTAFLAGQVLGPAGVPVRYEHDTAAFVGAVAGGWLGFVLAPTPLDLVLEHALAGKRMPPKTTLFWPKPRTGLLLRDLDS
jgi:uncharacterized protein (DUF1015 family)